MPIDPSVGRMVVETRHRDRDRDIERETHLIMMYVRSSAMVVASMCARACAVETGIHQMRSGRVAAGPCPPSFCTPPTRGNGGLVYVVLRGPTDSLYI